MTLMALTQNRNYREALEASIPALLLDVIEIKGKSWLMEKVNEAIAEADEPISQVPSAGQSELA